MLLLLLSTRLCALQFLIVIVVYVGYDLIVAFVANLQHTLNVTDITNTGHWIHTILPFARFRATAAVLNNQMYSTTGADNSFTMYNDVWTSTGNSTWWRLTATAPFIARYGASMVTYNNALVLVAGYNDFIGDSNDIWHSTNGATWKLVTAQAPFIGRQGGSMIVYNNMIILTTGVDSSNNALNDVWAFTISSTPFERCTCTAGWSGVNCTIPAFCTFSPCRNGATCENAVSGITSYTLLTGGGAFTPRATAGLVVTNNTMYMLHGYTTSPTNSVAASTNGILWVPVNQPQLWITQYDQPYITDIINDCYFFTVYDTNEIYRVNSTSVQILPPFINPSSIQLRMHFLFVLNNKVHVIGGKQIHELKQKLSCICLFSCIIILISLS